MTERTAGHRGWLERMRAALLILTAASLALGCAHGSQRAYACQRGFAPSCKRLIREHAIRQIENHPWVWECLAGADPDLRFVELTRTLQAPPLYTDAPMSATLESSDPQLQGCLDEALAHTQFGTSRWGYWVRVDYRAKLDPDHVARVWASAAKRDRTFVRVHEHQFDDPQPRPCPQGSSPDCTAVSSQAALDVVYRPWFDSKALRAAWSDDMPRQIRLSIQFCFGLESRLTHVAVLGDDPYPAISAVLTDEMRRWRIRPWVVDDRSVEFCTVRDYDVELWWSA